ncbi:MAG: ABC transporter ATP-binding protein [Lentisphaerae bacterium]|nr:ABC transporter ATP-binding protein [Lentisphaerota bacterium]
MSPPPFLGGRPAGAAGENAAKPQWRRLRRTFGPFLRPHLGAMALGTGCVFLGMLLQKCQPLLTKVLVDRGLTPVIQGPWSADLAGRSGRVVAIMVGAMLAAGGLGALIASLRTRVIQRAGACVVRDLRRSLYAHLQKLSLRYYESRRTGDVMSRVTGDVSHAEMLVTHVGDHFLVEIVSLVITVGILLAIHPQLALVALLPVPVLLVLMYRFGKTVRPVYFQIRERIGALSAKLQDNISGIRVIKAFSTERAEAARFDSANQAVFDQQVEGVRLMARAFPLIGFVQGLGTIVVTAVGGWMLLQPEPTLTLGGLFAFSAYVSQLYQPIGHLFMVYNTILQALAAGDRIADILETAPDMTDRPGATAIKAVDGEIRFDRVSFAYDPSQPVLSAISLHARPGQTIALVGHSGSGKTTLANLIPRFYDPTDGLITLDGHDLRDLELAALRRQIAVVLQDPFLFHGSIAENIRYAIPDAGMDAVRAAAEAAHADEFITAFPQGYESLIGERGVKLSGGQKQRLSIARAILADRRILILDEATSMIDTQSELLIQAALERLFHNRTCFVIAHRLSTIQRADQIIVLDQGRIVEHGRHHSLMAAGGVYARMYRAQFRLDDEDTAAVRPAAAPGVAMPSLSGSMLP